MVTLSGLALLFVLLNFGRVRSTVVLVTPKNETIAFPDTEASFAPRVPVAGLFGMVNEANPLNACEPLTNVPSLLSSFPIALVVRGMCTFQKKVQHAQSAGFAAVMIYDDEDDEDLITMSGDSSGIKIPAVFILKEAGEIIRHFAAENGTRCYILPIYESTAWSVMAVSFISLLAIIAVLAIFFVLRHNRFLQIGSRLGLTREPVTMTSKEVKALPTCIFKCIGDGNASSETCAICLEDYETGEKLRILPCHHEFHTKCIDQWLTTRRPFCPICKRDAHSKFKEPSPSENTPLLAPVFRERVQPAPESQEVAQETTGVLRENSNCEDIDGLLIGSPVGLPHGGVAQPSSPNRSTVGSPIDFHRQASILDTCHAGSPSKMHHQAATSQDLMCASSAEVCAGEQASESFDGNHPIPFETANQMLCGQCSYCSISSSPSHVHCSPKQVRFTSFLDVSSTSNSSPRRRSWDQNVSHPVSKNIRAEACISERNAQNSCSPDLRSSVLDQFSHHSGQSTAKMSDGADLC